jgi:hypothetical protein
MTGSKEIYEDQRADELAISEKQWIEAAGFSKESNKAIANKVIADCEQGAINPLDAYLLTKSMENTIKIIQEGIKEYAQYEADKFGEKKFTHRNCEIQVKEVGTKYDFANCKDPYYNSLVSEMEKLKEAIKAREAFLKTVQGEMQICDETTGGETVSIYPAIKSSSTGLVITIK